MFLLLFKCSRLYFEQLRLSRSVGLNLVNRTDLKAGLFCYKFTQKIAFVQCDTGVRV